MGFKLENLKQNTKRAENKRRKKEEKFEKKLTKKCIKKCKGIIKRNVKKGLSEVVILIPESANEEKVKVHFENLGFKCLLKFELYEERYGLKVKWD